MKCQILFSKKNISKCHLLNFLPSIQSVNIGVGSIIAPDKSRYQVHIFLISA